MKREKRLLLADPRDDRWSLSSAEGGVISKEIRRIFQRVRYIIDENQKKNRAKNVALRNTSLDRKRG